MSHEIRDTGYETPCWIWTGALNDRGYAKVYDPRRGYSRGAHRVVWETLRGDVPVGYEVDHLCRQRACVRIDHLELVTHQENMRRGYAVTRGSIPEGVAGEIKLLRLSRGLSQSDLAGLLGCSQPLVALWESGGAEPPRRRREQIAAVTREESG